MNLQFHDAARWLRELDERTPAETVWLAHNALRGSLWEDKFRGFINFVPMIEQAKKRAIERLERLPAWAPAVRAPKTLPRKAGHGWGTYGWKYDPSLVLTALKHQAAMIDTAETYGYGKVEEELGNTLGQLSPEERGNTLIATKVGRHHLGYDNVFRACERSRMKLQVPIDLYQVHWPVFPMEPTFEALQRLLFEEKINAVGVCNFSIDQLWEAQQILPDICSLQVRIAPDDQTAMEHEVLPFTSQMNITLIAHSPFGQKRTSEARTILDWLSARDILGIPGTNSSKHLGENLRRVQL